MGLNQSFNPQTSHLQYSPTYLPKKYLSQWQTIDHIDNYNLVRNIKTNIIGQSRRYKLDALYKPQDQVRIYEMRKNCDQPIVKAYSAEILDKISKKIGGKQQQREGICASNNYIGVVTQFIPYTLNNIKFLTLPQSLYTLTQTLLGFQHLYPRTGPVHITPKMLALTLTGNIKVWINEDFSQNHPTNQIKSLLSTRNQKLDRQYNMIAPQYRDQKQMIENIIDVVQQKYENHKDINDKDNKFSGQFGRGLRQYGFNFANALQYIDNYVKQNNIEIPNNLQQKIQQLNHQHTQLVSDILIKQKQQLVFQQQNNNTLQYTNQVSNVVNNNNNKIQAMSTFQQNSMKYPIYNNQFQNNTTHPRGYALYNNSYRQVHDNISIQPNAINNPSMIINNTNVPSNARINSNAIPSSYSSHIQTRTNTSRNNTNIKVRFNN